jgi:hypothetical protein
MMMGDGCPLHFPFEKKRAQVYKKKKKKRKQQKKTKVHINLPAS